MLSKNLILLRKQYKKTQAEVATLFNISRATYGSYEQGTREPNNDLLQKMAGFFNVSVDYLLGGTSDLNSIQLPESLNGVKFAFHGADDLDAEDIKDVENYIAFVRARKAKSKE